MEREQQQKIMTYNIFKEVVDAIFLFIEPLIRGLKKSHSVYKIKINKVGVKEYRLSEHHLKCLNNGP